MGGRLWRIWKMGRYKRRVRVAVVQFIYIDRHKMHTHIQCTPEGVNGMGCIGWSAPAAEAPGGVKRSGTLPTICKGKSRHVQHVPPATIFMKLLIAKLSFLQAWQWEPDSLLVWMHISGVVGHLNTTGPTPSQLYNHPGLLLYWLCHLQLVVHDTIREELPQNTFLTSILFLIQQSLSQSRCCTVLFTPLAV